MLACQHRPCQAPTSSKTSPTSAVLQMSASRYSRVAASSTSARTRPFCACRRLEGGGWAGGSKPVVQAAPLLLRSPHTCSALSMAVSSAALFQGKPVAATPRACRGVASARKAGAGCGGLGFKGLGCKAGGAAAARFPLLPSPHTCQPGPPLPQTRSASRCPPPCRAGLPGR